MLQIPGKLLFVLVKRYLCATSLLDKLSDGLELGGEQQDRAVPGPLTEARSRVKREFEFSMAMANLILELVHVMGWDRHSKPELPPDQELRPRAARSIFQHRAASCAVAQGASAPPPKEPSSFKTRSAFPSRSSYVEYVQATLVPGMRVRMLEDYEQVSAGDEGDFRLSNSGTPPVQVSSAGRAGLAKRPSAWLRCRRSGVGLGCPQLSARGALRRCTGKAWAARTGFTGTWWRSSVLRGKRSRRARRRGPP